MASQTADAQGFVTEVTLNHYRRLASSGAGLIFAEYTFVHISGKSETNQLGIDRDEAIEGLTQLRQTIQNEGALAGIQLVHAGGKTTSSFTGMALQAPSAVPVPVKGWEPAIPIEMSEADIRNWKLWFLAAAGRAAKAGFDVVELHAAHGYGLNQWLSPLTNTRGDSYGGTGENSVSNRARLLVEIAQEIHSAHPSLLLAVRLPAQDHTPGGLAVDDMHTVILALEKAGVDLIDVSSGIGGWRRPDGRNGEGYLVADAERIKMRTSLPVIGVGGIESGGFIDSAIKNQRLDFAAVGRAILSDPRKWRDANLHPHLSRQINQCPRPMRNKLRIPS